MGRDRALQRHGQHRRKRGGMTNLREMPLGWTSVEEKQTDRLGLMLA